MELMTSRQVQAEQTKAQIVNAVGDLMMEKDIRDLKIREICGKVGISVGTFYLYFTCKEAALLYSYRTADMVFEDLDLSGSVESCVRRVLRTHLELISEESLKIVKQIYICHLTYYDDYFFSEDRPFFVALNSQIARLMDGRGAQETKDITWKLLNMSRGFIFNLCIRKDIDIPSWRERKLEELMSYLRFLLYKTE